MFIRGENPGIGLIVVLCAGMTELSCEEGSHGKVAQKAEVRGKERKWSGRRVPARQTSWGDDMCNAIYAICTLKVDMQIGELQTEFKSGWSHGALIKR